MNILALNAGSSSLKYKLIRMPEEEVLSERSLDGTGEHVTRAALEAIEACSEAGIGAIGHRVVHGGGQFTGATRIDGAALASMRELRELDPLHNPVEVAVIEAGLAALPTAASVAIFDTAFHSTLPAVTSGYALPWELSQRLGLRRYGFHGISYRYVSRRLLECIGAEAAGTRLIVCHLGSGASICAIRDGTSVDTSMGMTPLEGLVMGTRCGDIDAGLLLYLLRAKSMMAVELDDLLNTQSGLKGVSGRSADERELEKAAAAGDERAEAALAMAAYRVRKYIGAYAAVMGGLDAIALTGGIGEHSAPMRARICRDLEFLGVEVDGVRNMVAATGPRLISRDGSRAPVWVIPTDEELQIARETYALLEPAE